MIKLKIFLLFFLSVNIFGQSLVTMNQSTLQLKKYEQQNFSFEKQMNDSLPPVTFGKILFEPKLRVRKSNGESKGSGFFPKTNKPFASF